MADYVFRYHDEIIEFLEVRKNDEHRDLLNPYCFAVAIYEKRDDSWELYSFRGLEKERPCELIFAPTLDEVLRLVEADEHRRFFG